MLQINTPNEGIAAIQDYFFDNSFAGIDDESKLKFKDIIKPGNSPTMASVEAVELIYAKRENMPSELLEIAAQLAMICQVYNFSGMAENNRGGNIANTLRTMDNVSSEPVELETEAPEVRSDYAPKPEIAPQVEPNQSEEENSY